MGRSTNQASKAATAFMMLATMTTACQLPVAAVSALDSGTSSAAVPLAVYSKPALAAAYLEPKVSAQVDGNRLKISPQAKNTVPVRITNITGLRAISLGLYSRRLCWTVVEAAVFLSDSGAAFKASASRNTITPWPMPKYKKADS